MLAVDDRVVESGLHRQFDQFDRQVVGKQHPKHRPIAGDLFTKDLR